MPITDLSASAQNYLKAIWAESEWSNNAVTASALTKRLGLRPSTVSEGIKKLQSEGLLTHTPYGAVELTARGKTYALTMVRRHRLIETFLVGSLGYKWHEVHDEADALEHAVSDLMVSRIADFLGHPNRDPHGDPIPGEDGSFTLPEAIPLNMVEPPRSVTLERIADDDPSLLQLLEENSITIGTQLRIEAGPAHSGTCQVHVTETREPVILGIAAMQALFVSVSS